MLIYLLKWGVIFVQISSNRIDLWIAFPVGGIIGFPELFRCHTGFLLEQLDKMALGRKGQVIADVDQGIVTEAQHILGGIQLYVPDIVAGGHPELFLEEPGNIAGGVVGILCQVLDGDPFLDMGIDIIQAVIDGTGHGGAVSNHLHLADEIHAPFVMERVHVLYSMEIIQFPDIEIAQPERLL